MEAVKPSIGRIVHYVSYGTPGGEYTSECRAAVVTAVQRGGGEQPGERAYQETASLAVLNPTGMFFNEGVQQDEDGHNGGTWHWPERV